MKEVAHAIANQGFIHKQGILAHAELSLINQFFESHKQEFAPASIGKGENLKRIEEIRGDHTYWLDTLNPPAVFSGIISYINDLKQSLNQELFLGLKEYECHLAAYQTGSFYKKHLDKHTAGSSRVLSFIFYLHEKWSKGDGGELVIYDQDQKIIQTVEPIPGSMICFLSENFPHEVRTSHIERRSLTGWIHNKIIT